MITTKTLCFYYPTTVVLVDDNQKFLENLPDNLSENSLYKTFTSPEKALHFIEKSRQSSPEDFLGKSHEDFTGIPLNVDLPKIRAQLENKDRAHTPSVVVVDHDMPEMSGFEFCKKLTHSPIKKIMLTGAADRELAIRAFNEGIIQKFIPKDDPKVMENLDKAIQALQQEYFATLSELIVKNITTTTFSFLRDEAFKKFIADFIQAHYITEFYLTDSVGSFLMLDHQGKKIWLTVQSHQEIERFCEMAKDYEAAPDIIHALEKKEKLLCLHSEEDFKQPTTKWKKLLHEAKKIPDVKNGYFSVIF